MRRRLPTALLIDVDTSLEAGARETLAWFRTKGTRAIGLSETPAGIVAVRLQQLGLDGAFDLLYAAEPCEPLILEETICRPLQPPIAQPVLLRILSDLDVLPSEALLIGARFATQIGAPIEAGVPHMADLQRAFADDPHDTPAQPTEVPPRADATSSRAGRTWTAGRGSS